MKKERVQYNAFVFIIILIIILSCTKNAKNLPAGILLQTSRDFSAMSVKEGLFKDFLFYIVVDGVILRYHSYP
jgi:hypothetical protein